MTTSPKDQLLHQLAQHVIFAGQRTLDVVGYGRGSSKKATYFETLAVHLAAQLEQQAAFPLRVVLEWLVEIEVEGISIDDSTIPLVITLPIRENKAVHIKDPSLVQVPPQIFFDDLSQLAPPDIDLFPLLPIFGNVTANKKPFPKDLLRNAAHLAERVGAPFYALINFGKPKIRTFFPQTRQDDTVTLPLTVTTPTIADDLLAPGTASAGEPVLPEESAGKKDAEEIKITDIKLPSTPKSD